MVLQGKVAVVTGGASGIGAGIVQAYAKEGATVVIADRDQTTGLAMCAAMGPAISMLAVDICEVEEIRAAVERVVAIHEGIDILVNCAGVVSKCDFLTLEPDEFDRVFDINVRGSFFFGQAAARAMVERGKGGRIINIGSIGGLLGYPTRSAYGPSKAAVMQLTRSMAVELVGHGILVNGIAPGPVETPLVAAAYDSAFRAKVLERVPLQRFGLPEDIAGVALFLASDASAFIVGQTITVDGGTTITGVSSTPGA